MKEGRKDGSMVFSGQVVPGQGRGRDLGFPTANLKVVGADQLPRGVYVAKINGAAPEPYWSVANIGYRPTFGRQELAVEVHVLDFTGDLYERNIEVVLKKKLRDERAFTGSDQLVAQICSDIQQARALIADLWVGAQLPNMEIEDVDNY